MSGWQPKRRVGVGAGLFGTDLGLPPLDSFNPVPDALNWAQQNVVEPVQQVIAPAIQAVTPQGPVTPLNAGLTTPGQEPTQQPYGPLTPLNKPRVEDQSVAYHAQRASDLLERGETPPMANDQEGDLTAGFEEFGNAHLEALFEAAGLGGATSAACGPIAIAGVLRAFGIDVDPATIAKKGQDSSLWNASLGMLAGDGSAVSKLLKSYSVSNQNLPADENTTHQVAQMVARGVPVILNGPNHYLLAQDYDEATGKFFVGSTGSNALEGGADWMTLDEIGQSPGVGGPIQSFIVPSSVPASTLGARSKQRFSPNAASDPNAAPGEVEQYIRQAAQSRGINPDVAIRIAQHEGGLEPARRGTFSTGSSWWPFQLHYGGQGYEQFGNVAGMGNAFTQATGYQPGDPAAWRASVDYALDQAAQAQSWAPWYGRGPAGVGVNEGFS